MESQRKESCNNANTSSPRYFLKEEVCKELPTFSEARRPTCHSYGWKLSTLAFAVSTTVLFVQSLQSHPNCSADGFPTEMKAPLEGLSLEKVKFTGALTYDDNGTLINQHLPGEKIWFGDPSPQIDSLWDSIAEAQGFLVEGKEADLVRDGTALYQGYWFAGLDVFHQLHCLDAVRKSLYPEYYPPEADPRTEKLHLEHCLDYIRQALMCTADVTPVRQRWIPQRQKFGPEFATKHTCRPFDSILGWALERTPTARSGTHGNEVATKNFENIMDDKIVGHGNHADHPGRGK